MVAVQAGGEEPDSEGGELEDDGHVRGPTFRREPERHERPDEQHEQHAEAVLGLLTPPFQPAPWLIHRRAS